MWTEDISWNDQGLIPVIAQDHQSGRVLMMAWMNAEALKLTVETGNVVYYSRSRQRLWHKGETSGNNQVLMALRVDCDNDVLLATVEQVGGIACHTGRESCFFKKLQGEYWVETDPVLKNPADMYGEMGE